MLMPNYQDGSIVNIMSTMEEAYGLEHAYGTLKGLDPGEIGEFRNVVFILIDGLGYQYLGTHQRDSFIHDKVLTRITSVFPTTTSASITSLATGVAPQQHAVTGWFMHLKEVGVVSQILPFNPRIGGMMFSDIGLTPSMFIDRGLIFDRLPVDCTCIIKDDIIASAFSSFMAGMSERVAYVGLEGFFKRIREACAGEHPKKFIYAYWSHFDTLCHLYGVDNEATHAHFREIDDGLRSLYEDLSGSDTCIIVTADHGQLDVTDETTVQLSDHPSILNCMTLPICGEARAAFCYVRPRLANSFERYVEDELGEYCALLKGHEMIEEGFFGSGEPNPRLFDRVGDYVLMMKDNYVIRDRLLGEREHVLKGYHGGLDSEELYVPLLYLT